ncbi:hypothetical protein D5085_00135 [Ectothiorhodospiraceae bacterium BW-2]|nr:hypothetical protein D5085_00135 [Ectothiorhodospiraceae bacterium BW-2]
MLFEFFDYFAGGPERLYGGSLLNGCAGLLLLLTQAYPRFFTIEQKSGQNNLHYDLGTIWVIGYVVWNFTFVYGTNPPNEPTGQWAAAALVHLLAPLLLMGGNAMRFIQARSYSLALVVGWMLVAPGEPYVYTVPEWYHQTVAELLAALSLAIVALFLGQSVRHHYRSDTPPSNLLITLLNRLFERR